MRSPEERIAEVKRRIAKKNQKDYERIPDCRSFRRGGMPCCDRERFPFLAWYSQPD